MTETIIQCFIHGWYTALELCPRCANWKRCKQIPKEKRKELEAYVKWEKANFAEKLEKKLDFFNYKQKSIKFKEGRKQKQITVVGTDLNGTRVKKILNR